MDPKVKRAIHRAVKKEPFVRLPNIKLVELSSDFSAVEMTYDPARMDNIYSRTHGEAVQAIIHDTFETVRQTEGAITVALKVNVSYVASPSPTIGTWLRAGGFF